MEMKGKIVENLRRLEEQREIKILFACESGSRAWGFDSADSDYDVRFIYAHRLDWYLDLGAKKDTIKAVFPGDLDFSGWELRKALELFRASNFSIFEWLGSPITYMKDADFFGDLTALKPLYFNPRKVAFSYLSLAGKSFEKFAGGGKARLKKLLYTIRALLACKWVLEYATPPPTLFESLYKDANICESRLKAEIEKIVESKRLAAELSEMEVPEKIADFIRGAQVELSKIVQEMSPPDSHSPEELRGLFRKVVLGWK